ncbi:MAG: class I SAM-dependent methyltransferase [Bacteroidales bacterium]|nr:class I SAM-dependent methyltransferase [Bacteroidales bacterium]
MTAHAYLKEKLSDEVLLFERRVSDLDKKTFDTILMRWSDDSKNMEEHRYVLINILIPQAKKLKILDMAAGCGSFVLQGLLNGYDTYGVEPEDWKHELIDIKFKENNYTEEWRRRLIQGVGEDLPFDDNYFDIFDSWQTIEHVQNQEKCIQEFYRVLKPGGMGILRGPNYFSFYEGHYRMFWFPMLNPKSKFAKWYTTKVRKRPVGGLDTFVTVNPRKIKKYARNTGFKVVNIKRKQIFDASIRRLPILKYKIFYPSLLFIYLLWDIYKALGNFGIGQRTISYLLIKE